MSIKKKDATTTVPNRCHTKQQNTLFPHTRHKNVPILSLIDNSWLLMQIYHRKVFVASWTETVAVVVAAAACLELLEMHQ